MIDLKISELWETIVGSKKDLSAEELYVLLKPDDRKQFMDTINTDLFSYEERVQGIRFLIEYEKEKESSIYIPSTPITYPSYPINIPYYPQGPDTMPWQSPIIYCSNTPATNHCFITTTTTH